MEFILFLTLLPFYLSDELKKISLGYLSKRNYKIAKNNSNFVYLDRSDFDSNEEIHLNVTIYKGELIHNFLYYKESHLIPNNENYQNFTYSQKCFYYSKSSGSFYNNISDSYCNYNSYFFKVKKPITKYLLVSFPEFNKSSNGSALIEFSQVSKKAENLNIGIIIGITVGTLYIIVIIVMIIKNILKKREKDRYGLNYMALPKEAYTSIDSILSD